MQHQKRTGRTGRIESCFILGILVTIMLVSPCLAAAKTFNLKLQHFSTGDEFKRCTQDCFCPLVDKMTHGQIKITPFPGGALVPVKEMVNGACMGIIDIAYFVGGYCGGLVPVAEIMGGLPYAFENLHDAQVFMWHRGYIQILREEFKKHNLYIIPIESYNIGVMSNKPINALSDLKGTKMRSHSTLASWLAKAGASVVFIPATELYTGLATGVVDGASWGDAGPMYEMKFPEVLKNYMLPEPLIGAWNVVLINLDVWNSFSPEQQTMFESASLVAGKVADEQTRVFYHRALNAMHTQFGVNIVKLSDEEQENARGLAKETLEDLGKKHPLNAKVLKMVDDYMKEKEICPNITPLPW